jgi:hypothetical protein
MDWNAAIEKNREALKRILAMLVAMAELAGGGATLPRHLHRAVLRLLRPAESAARRLVIVAARGLVVTLPPPRPRKAKPGRTILRNGVGTGILMPPGTRPSAQAATAPAAPLSLPLLDPLPCWGGRRRPAASSVPRISLPGYSVPFPVAPRRAPASDDPIDAGRLKLRLAALAAALDDLPRQARRFARWRARIADAAGKPRDSGRIQRLWPMRPGRPPGFRRRPTHEVDEILKIVHGLAFWALERPDTS